MKILYCSLDVKGTSFVSRVSTELRFLFTLHTKNLLRAFYEYQYYNYKNFINLLCHFLCVSSCKNINS